MKRQSRLDREIAYKSAPKFTFWFMQNVLVLKLLDNG